MKRFFAVWLAAVLFLLLYGDALGTSSVYLLTALVIGGAVSIGWLLWHVVCAAGSAAVSTGHALRDVGRAGANLHSARVHAIEAARLSDDLSRREAARARCDVFYRRHLPEIAPRFSREEYDGFVKRHLGDEHPAASVERMAEALLDILRSHLNKVEPPKTQSDVTALLAAFTEQRRRLLESDLDQDTKDILLIGLDERREEVIRKRIQEMNP